MPKNEETESTGPSFPEQRQRMEWSRKLVTEEDVINFLSEALGHSVQSDEVKKIEQVAHLCAKK